MDNAFQRLESLQVRDVMARHVVQIAADQTLREAAQLFAQHDISAAPVVDSEGSCVGIISATDFLKCDAGESAGDNRVAAHMTSPVQSVASGDLLLDAARLMDGRHLHRLPVLDDEGQPVGMISTMDIVAALLNAVEEVKARS